MRTVPAAITTARQSASSRLCKIWRIERRDGTVYRMTEHDRDIEVGGEVFESTASFDPSAIKATGDLAVDDLDVLGAFDSATITAIDLMAGRWAGATFWVAEVDWSNLAAGKDVLRWGWIGRVAEKGGQFVAELLGPTVRLQQTVGDLYSATCRATLGDAYCTVDMAPHTFAGVVTAVTDRRQFAAAPDSGGFPSPLPDPLYFQHGLLTWTSGDNDGVSMEVSAFDGTDAELLLSMPFDISPGDAFTITAGCDHSRETCRDRFGNVLNFQGEPDMPVSDDVIRGPDR